MSLLRNERYLVENEKWSHVHDSVVVSRHRAEVKVDISRCFVGVMFGDGNSVRYVRYVAIQGQPTQLYLEMEPCRSGG